MDGQESGKRVLIHKDELLDAIYALHAGIESNKFDEKESAMQFALNRLFAHLTPEDKAQYNEWVERKGWRGKELIVLS